MKIDELVDYTMNLGVREIFKESTHLLFNEEEAEDLVKYHLLYKEKYEALEVLTKTKLEEVIGKIDTYEVEKLLEENE